MVWIWGGMVLCMKVDVARGEGMGGKTEIEGMDIEAHASGKESMATSDDE